MAIGDPARNTKATQQHGGGMGDERMTFQEWLKTDNGRMVTFDTDLKRMLENVWMASAEAAEAKRDAAQLELQQIRIMLDDGTNGNASSALDMVKRLQAGCYAARREAWYERM